VLVGWEVICRAFGIRPFLLPAPSAIWMAVVPIWPNIAMHTATTLRTVLLGLLASIVVSLPLAMLIASSRTISAAIYPLLVLTQSVPKVALAPILLVALGYSILPKIIVAFLIAFFPVVVNTVTGLASVDRDTLNLMRSMGASKTDVFLRCASRTRCRA